jgi:hypothetical protein
MSCAAVGQVAQCSFQDCSFVVIAKAEKGYDTRWNELIAWVHIAGDNRKPLNLKVKAYHSDLDNQYSLHLHK